MRIAVLANLKEDAPVRPEDPPGRWDDLDDRSTVNAVVNALRDGGFEAQYFAADLTLVDTLPYYKPDLCFNYSVGKTGDARTAQIPALLDMMGIPYTGSGIIGMSLAHNKPLAKQMMRQAHIPTPDSFVVARGDDLNKIPVVPYPLFVKPAHDGTSVGINESALVRDRSSLERQIFWINDVYDQPALVESFLEGRELTVAVLGNRALPVVEIRYPGPFYNHSLKEVDSRGVERICPAPISRQLTQRLQKMALQAMKALHVFDYARMDVRLAGNGLPYVLEVNPVPLLMPDAVEASFYCAARAAGMDYTDMICEIVAVACERLGLPIPVQAKALRLREYAIR